jgi:hypothetical protein
MPKRKEERKSNKKKIGRIVKMRLHKIYILCFILFSVQLLSAQEVFLKASVSKSELGVNQRLRINFTINKQGADDFKLPDFKNFTLLGGPNTSISRSIMNGRSSFSQTYSYIIQPKKQGTYTIPSATIEYKGETLQSNTISIKVLSASEVPKDVNDPLYIAGQNVHLIAEVSNSNPYVGEGIYVVYKLYFSTNIGLNNPRLKENPKFNGFWNQDFEITNFKVENTTYKGEEYRYFIVKRALLVPQKSGKLVLEALDMDMVVNVPTGQGDFFGNPITRRVQYLASSGKRNVNVKPLPIEGKPEDFTGAVGEFNFKVSATKEAMKSNEASQIKVEVFGKGNLKLFELPKINTPSELEVYMPERDENVRTTLNGISGNISDSYTVVPEFKGKYKIPEVSFSYFNPKEEKYMTLISETLIMNVIDGKSLPSSSSNQVSRGQKQNVVSTGKNFNYIQNRTSFNPIKKKDFFKSNLFYLLLFLPIIAIPIGIFIGNKKEERDGDVVGNRLRKADRLAKRYLSEAKKKLGDNEAFYIALERALHNFLKAKLNIETSDISQEKISEILEDKKVDTTTISQFIEVLNDCDFARYTPSTSDVMQQEFDKAKIAIAQIDKQL